MRKRKGAALPGTMMLCFLLLAVTFSVSYLVIHYATLAKVGRADTSHRVEFVAAFEKFKFGTPVDEIHSDHFVYSSLEKDDIKALVAKNKAGQMRHYGIYDFSSGETLAFQSEDFYITVVEGKSYLGGLLLMEEE